MSKKSWLHLILIPIKLEETREFFSKIQQDLDYNLGFLKSIKAKLSNKRFVDNAPKNVINNELKKEKDTLSKIEILKNKLNK